MITSNRPKIGFLINPVAGLGGRVGLKGSDGHEIQKKALGLGAQPWAPIRAAESLTILSSLRNQFDLYVAAGEMGERVARLCGFNPIVIYHPNSPQTSAEDTMQTARIMKEMAINVLLFAGGDGTARDICSAIGEELTVIGIPAGVKIYSAVFAKNPKCAGYLAREYITYPSVGVEKAEVIDLDEETYRAGRIHTRLYGFMRIPKIRHLVQKQKAPTTLANEYQAEAIATEAIERMKPNIYYALGPGTIPNVIGHLLNIDKTLVGFDLIKDKTMHKKDVNEAMLLEVLNSGEKLGIIVTPIGGQGYLFGRGNPQISARVLEKVSVRDILVVSLAEKIHALKGQPLLVDTGDSKIDQALSGYIQVITGYRESIVYPVRC